MLAIMCLWRPLPMWSPQSGYQGRVGHLVAGAGRTRRIADKNGSSVVNVIAEESDEGLLLPPALGRIVAFAIDSSLLLVLFSIALSGTALAGRAAVRSLPVMLLWFTLVVAVNACFQGVVVWLSGGQTVGKALIGLSVRLRDGSHIAQSPFDLVRIVLRFSLGYLVFDVFLIAAAWCLRDPARRCPHDIVLGTQLVQVREDIPRTRNYRFRKFQDDVETGLEIVREEWGHWYRFFKWSSRFVILIVGLFAALMTKFGLLSSASVTSSSSSISVASSVSTVPTTAASATTAIGTATVSVTLIVAGVAASDAGRSPVPESAALQASFEETHSELVLDDSRSFSGSLHGGVRLVEATPGDRALELDGSGWVDFGNEVDQRGSVTVEAWVRPEGQQRGWAAIVDRWQGSGYYWLGTTLPSGGYEWWIGNTTVRARTGVLPSTWQHVTATYDARTGRLAMYIDGRLEGEGQHGVPVESTSGDIYVGGSGTGGWRGLIDDVQIWNGVRSPREICEDAGGNVSAGGVCDGVSRQ